MAREILSDFGPERSIEGNRASNGGVQEVKPTSYSPPTGPSNINDSKTPGIHGDNHGCCGTQGKH